MAVATPRPRAGAPIYEGTRIPHPIPTVLRTPPALQDTGDIMTVNFGPKFTVRTSSEVLRSSRSSSTLGIGEGIRVPV